jgi:glycosyltransferase involved in cell wall biosynthesis
MKATVLIIGFVYPEPNSSAAGTRMLQLINFFNDQNYTIVFATTCKKSHNAFDLESLNVQVVDIILNDSSFDIFAQDLNPHIVLFDRFMSEEQFGWRIVENCPNALRILDTEDLHFVRKTRSLFLNSHEICLDDFMSNEITKREIASLYRCDLSLIISECEFEILVDTFKVDSNLLLYLPFMIDANHNLEINRFKSFDDRTDFVSIGNFLHSPNLDAVSYLKKDIWPSIKSCLPEANLHIYGAYDTQAVRSMHNIKDGFLVHGFVEDAFEVVNSAKVLLAPLRFGSGLKGKLVQAMQCGTPSVMSTIAAEGMFGSLQPNGFIENDSNLYIEKCIDLYSTESVWNDFQNKGFRVLELRFNKEELYLKLIDRIKLLTTTINSHRSSNFIGQLLAYHQFQSTKYMSRWIEEKKRLK